MLIFFLLPKPDLTKRLCFWIQKFLDVTKYNLNIVIVFYNSPFQFFKLK